MLGCSRNQQSACDFSFVRTVNRVSNLAQELRSYVLRKRRRKTIDVVGDWGVGKDSLVLRVLDMDIPDPKLEQDHPSVRRRSTRYIRNLKYDETFDLTFRIIPGKYRYREIEKDYFDYIRPGDYEVDALVFCFALNNIDSFDNLQTKWIPKASIVFGNNMPAFILVGTKCDLPKVTRVTTEYAVRTEQALHLKETTRAVEYVNCSARVNIQIIPIRNMLLNILSLS